ncbi:MAG TPA: hypothetical protein VIG50_18990 [Vicinamibacteria bacterium]
MLASLLSACGNGSDPGRSAHESGPQLNYRETHLDSTTIVEVPDTGISLGWGWNTFHGESVPTICVEFVEGNEPGQTSHMSMHEVSDSYEVMQRMGLSAEASVKTIGYEVGGKAQFAKELDINGFSSSFVLQAAVENGVRYAAPLPVAGTQAAQGVNLIDERGGTRGAIRLTGEALALAKRRDRGEFEHACGNAFVSAVFSGAKLTAVLTIKATTQSEQETIAAELTGSGWGARMKANFDNTAKDAYRSERMRLSLFQTGGKGKPIPVTKADLLDRLEHLAQAADQPKDFHMAITPYEALSNWPGEDLTGPVNELEQLASYWGSYNSLYNEIQYILDHPTDFVAATMDAAGKVSFPRHPPARPPAAKPSASPAATAPPPPTALTHDQILALETMQDAIMGTLERLRQDARDCVFQGDECSFSEHALRSPYAYRIQLPLPNVSEVLSAEALVDYYVRDPAKRRCQLGTDDPGCLSNTAIRGWQGKVGMKALKLPDKAALQAVAERLAKATLDDGATPIQFSEEQESSTLWCNPAHEKQVLEVVRTVTTSLPTRSPREP